ncbi:unnamed protein product [Hapterophycus canaliculatus]
MSFFNNPHDEDEDGEDCGSDQTRLALMRTFEARLWELDVQVQGIKCIGFGQAAHSDVSTELIQRCSRAGVSVVRESSEGFHSMSLWPQSSPLLLAEEVEPQQFKLSLVTIAASGRGRGHQVRELIYLTPLQIQEFNTLVEFVLSYHQWCA